MASGGRGLFCLVTIHGIGFQQAPTESLPGYADGLHRRLSRFLDASLLADDLHRPRERRGENGPVYVQSHWPPLSNDGEAGLARLGSWTSRRDRLIDVSKAPLRPADERIAHVALVYSHLEEQWAHPGSGILAGSMAVASAGHYASILGLTRMAFLDTWSAITHQASQKAGENDDGQGSELRVREGSSVLKPPLSAVLPARLSQPRSPTSLLAVVRELEADVATYVCRNDLRERVRAFVREALIRILSRPDVDGVVINSHSNGTVIAFDVLGQLPLFLGSGVKRLITSGSPLRKYTDLFNWGNQVGSIREAGGWTNFWDPRDPVADPLVPGPAWQPGDPAEPSDGASALYSALDPDGGNVLPVPIRDVQVDNLSNAPGGGLRAHDYWGNNQDVIEPLARLLERLAV